MFSTSKPGVPPACLIHSKESGGTLIPFDAPAGDPKRLLRKDAANGCARLVSEGKKAVRLTLWGVSGYRPYSRQEELYEAALKKANLTVDSPPEELM